MKWIFLAAAILSETIATSALKYSDGFKVLVPSIIVIIGYGVSFFFLSLTLRHIPIGIAYAIWSGVGIVIISLIGYFAFKQVLDAPAIIGLVLIVAGVVVINLFSRTVTH